MTVEEAEALGQRAIYHATFRDAFSGVCLYALDDWYMMLSYLARWTCFVLPHWTQWLEVAEHH